MSAIKVNLVNLETEINTFRDAGNNISTAKTNIDSSGVNTLDTCLKYIEQHKKIASLLNVCKSLINKDAEDIDKMKHSVTKLDEDISSVYLNIKYGG